MGYFSNVIADARSDSALNVYPQTAPHPGLITPNNHCMSDFNFNHQVAAPSLFEYGEVNSEYENPIRDNHEQTEHFGDEDNKANSHSTEKVISVNSTVENVQKENGGVKQQNLAQQKEGSEILTIMPEETFTNFSAVSNSEQANQAGAINNTLQHYPSTGHNRRISALNVEEYTLSDEGDERPEHLKLENFLLSAKDTSTANDSIGAANYKTEESQEIGEFRNSMENELQAPFKRTANRKVGEKEIFPNTDKLTLTNKSEKEHTLLESNPNEENKIYIKIKKPETLDKGIINGASEDTYSSPVVNGTVRNIVTERRLTANPTEQLFANNSIPTNSVVNQTGNLKESKNNHNDLKRENIINDYQYIGNGRKGTNAKIRSNAFIVEKSQTQAVHSDTSFDKTTDASLKADNKQKQKNTKANETTKQSSRKKLDLPHSDGLIHVPEKATAKENTYIKDKPSVIIGRIDVTVISTAPVKPPQATAGISISSSSDLASRNYLRRL